jgi:hypothetical protein
MAAEAPEIIRNLQVTDVTTAFPVDCDVPLSLLWARNLREGLFDCPLASASCADTPRYDVQESTLQLRCAP